MKDHLDQDYISVTNDVKLEVVFGLFLAIVGSILLKASQVRNCDLIHSYQTKTMEQVLNRKNFRNV